MTGFMTHDVLALSVAALAMATATRGDTSDPATLDLVLDSLPDDAAPEFFVALLRVFQAQHDRYGAAALQRTGLALARRTAGLDP